MANSAGYSQKCHNFRAVLRCNSSPWGGYVTGWYQEEEGPKARTPSGNPHDSQRMDHALQSWCGNRWGQRKKQQTWVPFSEVQTYARSIYDEYIFEINLFMFVFHVFMFVFHVSLFLHVRQYYLASLSILCIFIYIYIYDVHLCLNVKIIRDPYVLWSCWPRSPGAQREKEAKEAKAKAVGVPKVIRIYIPQNGWWK